MYSSLNKPKSLNTIVTLSYLAVRTNSPFQLYSEIL